MFLLLLIWTLPCVFANQVVIMLFATSNVYRGYEVNDANCQADATSRGFANPENAKAFVEGFNNSDWNSEMRILGPTKKRISRGDYFQTMPSLYSSFADADTGCTTSVWTGSIKSNEDGYNCEDWSVSPDLANGVYGRISSCTTGGAWSETTSVQCNQYYRHMCYIHVEMIPTNQIMLFATTGTYQGHNVKDANCELSALAYGFPSGSKALVQGFNQSIFQSFTPIIGPTGTSLSYGFRFIEGNYLDVSLAEAQTCVGFYGLMWSGWLMDEPSLPISFSDCNQWTQTDLNATLLRCTNQFYSTELEDFCTAYHQHLCYVEVNVPPWTRSPTFGSPTSQQPTMSPTPVNQLVMFATTNTYHAYEVGDANCQETAETLGFSNPSAAKAFVENDSQEWEELYVLSRPNVIPVVGPTGVFIKYAHEFIYAPNAQLESSFKDAGVGCNLLIWTGVLFPTSTLDDCDNWGVSVEAAEILTGTYSRCDFQLAWQNVGQVLCKQQMQHLCYIEGALPPSASPVIAPSGATNTPTLQPTLATNTPTTKTPTTSFFPPPNSYIIYRPPITGNVSKVQDENCFSAAADLGLPNPELYARALAAYHMDGWDDNRIVVGPTGLYITTAENFRTNDVDAERTLEEAEVGCDSGVLHGFSYTSPFDAENHCANWTSSSGSMNTGSCTQKKWLERFTSSCNVGTTMLCYYATPVSVTGSPTIDWQTSTNTYMVFATYRSVFGNAVNEALCEETAYRAQYPGYTNAKALVYPVSGWNDSYDVIGPTGLYITSAENFRTNQQDMDLTLEEAGVCSDSVLFTGFLTSSFSVGQTCVGWSTTGSVASFGMCVTSTWRPFGTSESCAQQHRYLCYIELEPPPTLSPTPLPTGSPIPSSNLPAYRVFATPRTYHPDDIKTENCIQRATELGFANASDARVLASTFVHDNTWEEGSWNDSYIVTGPTGIFIASGYVFRRNLQDQQVSLEEAFVGCSNRVWTGFARYSFNSEDDCSGWNSLPLQTGITGSCSNLRWKDIQYVGCTVELQHLCYVPDQDPISIAPTQSPTVYVPGPKRSPYYLFATDELYPRHMVDDENCKITAARLNLPTPNNAWALVDNATNLVYWESTRDVFNIQGQFITKAGNLLSQEVPLSTYLTEVGCTGDIWTKYGSIFAGNVCDAGTCETKTVWKTGKTDDCLTELPHLCIYNQTLPPSFIQTKSPTTFEVTSSPTTWTVTDHDYILFLTENTYTGDEVNDEHCQEAAGALDPIRVVAYVQGHDIVWNHSANVFTSDGEFVATVTSFSTFQLSRPLQLAGLNCTRVWSGFTPFFPPLQAATCNFWSNPGTTGVPGFCDTLDFVSYDPVPCTTAYPYLCLYVPFNSKSPTQSPTKSPFVPTQQPTKSPNIQSYTLFTTDKTYKGYEVSNANCREKASELGYDTTKTWSLHAGNDFSWWRSDTSIHSSSGTFIANSASFRTGDLDFTFNEAGLSCTRVWTGFQATSFVAERRTCLDWHVAASNASNYLAIVGGCDYRKAWRYTGLATCDESLPQLCIYTGSTNTLAPTKQPTATTKSPTTPTLSPTLSPTIAPVTLFSTVQTYKGNEVKDSNCWETAVTMGFSNPTATWALVRGNPNLTTLSLDRAVVGPSGVQIGVRTSYFLDAERTTIHPALLNDARVCFGPIWTGGISMEVTNDCNNWSSDTSTGIVGSCDHKGLGAAPSGELEQVNHAWAFASINSCANTYAHLCIHPDGATVGLTTSPTVAASPVVAPTHSPDGNTDFTAYYLFLTETRHVGYDVKDENCEATAAAHGYTGMTKALVLGIDWDDALDVYGPFGTLVANASTFRSQYNELAVSLAESGLECTEVWTGFINDDFIGLKETSCENWSVPFWLGSSSVATYGTCTQKTYWASYGVKQCTKLLPHLCVSSVQFVKTKSPTVSPPTVMPTIKRPTTNPPSWAPTKLPTPTPTNAPVQNRYVVFAVPEKISMAENPTVFQELCIKQKLRLGLEGPVDPLVAHKGTVYLNWQDAYRVYSPTGTFIATGANFRLNNAAYVRNLRDAGVGCDGDIWTGLGPNTFQPFSSPCSGPGTHASGSCVTVNHWRKTGLLSCSFKLQFLCVSIEPCTGACTGSQPATTPYPTLTPTKPPTGVVNTVNRYVVYTTTNKYKGNEVRDANCQIPGSWALVAHAPQLYHWNDEYLVYGPSGHYIGTGKQFREQTFTDSTLLGSGLDCTEIWTGFYSGGGFNTIDSNHCDYWESPNQLASYGVCDDTRGWGYIARTTCDDTMYHLCVYRGLPFGAPPSSPPVTKAPTSTQKLYVYSAEYSLGDSMDATCAQRAVEINMPYPDKTWTYIAGSLRFDGIDLSRMITLYPQETPIANLKEFRNNFYAYGSSLSQHDGVCGIDVGPYWAQFQTHSFGRHPFLTDGQGRSLYRILSCLPNQSPTAEVYYDFGGTRILCAFYEEDLFGFTPEPTFATAFPSRAPTTSFPTRSPTIAPTVAYYTLFTTSETYKGNEVRDINCQKTAYTLGLPDPVSSWALVEGSSKTLLPSKDVYSHTGVFLGKATAFRLTQMTPLQVTLQDAGLDCIVVWRGATIQGYLSTGFYSEVATCLNWTVSASRFNGATVGCSDSLLQIYRTSTCATSWKHLCIYEGTPPPPTSAPTGRPTLSCNANPPIAQSAFVFTSDQCLTKRLYDIAKTIYINVQSVSCLNDTVSIGTHDLTMVGINTTHVFDTTAITVDVWYRVLSTLPVGRYPLLQTVNLNLSVEVQEGATFLMVNDTHGIETTLGNYVAVVKDGMVCTNNDEELVCSNEWVEVGSNTLQTIHYFGLHALSMFNEALSILDIEMLFLSTPFVGLTIPFNDDSSVEFST